MLATPNPRLPSAGLIPPAAELRFRVAAAERDLDFLRRLLRVAERAEGSAPPALTLVPADDAPVGQAVARG